MTLVSHSENNLVPNVFPAGMQNSELILKDEEGNSVLTELDELSSASEQNINPTAINIENSSDVIIGPVTQFHGPVTIYQNVNGQVDTQKFLEAENQNVYQNGKQLVKSESSASDSASHQADNKSSKSPFSYSMNKKYIAIALLLSTVIIIIGIVCAIIFLSNSKQSPNNSSQSLNNSNRSEASGTLLTTASSSVPPYENQTDGGDHHLQPIGPGSIVDRTIWGGHPALNFTKPLKHPVPLVIISHTATPFCNSFVNCSARVRSIQEYHINTLESPDIGYNFLIGGDAVIYVGRGWDIRNFHSDDTIGISFIGNYITDNLTDAMINSAKSLLDLGVKTGKLAKNYKLVGHNQTFRTLSPGRNVMEVIETWAHYDPQSYMS